MGTAIEPLSLAGAAGPRHEARLLDNFEWIFGYEFRYGLHEVDRTTFVRTAKPSAGVYSAIVRAHAVNQ